MIGSEKSNPKIQAEITSLNAQIADMRKWREEAKIAFQMTDDEFIANEKRLVEKRLALHKELQCQDSNNEYQLRKTNENNR